MENIIDKSYVKADIFFEPVAFSEKKKGYTVKDALSVCLNQYNFVQLDYIAQLAKMSYAEAREELQGIIYYNPILDNYELTEKFLSGNVVEKLGRIQAMSVSEYHREDYNQSVLELEKVIPERIPLEEIGINLGERWIPISFYKEFSKYLLNPPGTHDAGRGFIHITYNSDIDDFFCQWQGNKNTYMNQFAVQTYNRYYRPEDVFRFAMKDTTPTMTKKINRDGVEITVPDNDGIQKMNLATEKIRENFKSWMINNLSEQDKTRLEVIYNRMFNNTVKPKFNGSYQQFPHLNYEGLNIKELYPSQKDAIVMLKNNFGGLIDHEVGGGKTLIACVSTYEMKRLGLVNKPMIIGIKANVGEIAKTFQKAYPNAKVLFPEEKDMSKNNLDSFLAKIQNNNWDCIIMSHEQFAIIPQSYEVMKEIADEKIKALEIAIDNLSFDNPKDERRARKALEAKIVSLKVNLEKRAFEIENKKSKSVVDFKTMGIDYLVVDESHKFKNLGFETKHTRVAGLGDQFGSQRSSNLLYAIRTIQKNDKDFGATFLSGTPISNSLTELYNILYYLRPNALKDKGMFSFDAWIATYAEKTKEFEFSVTNDIIQKERFRQFIKVPELASFYAEFTDYKTAEMIGIERPEKNEVLVELEKTPDQVEMFERLKQFAKEAKGELIYRTPLTESEEKAKMLIATDVSRKASLDMRLISHDFEDHPKSKVNQAVERISDYYVRFNEPKGTQFVFCDLGTFKGGGEWSIYSDIKEKLVQKGVPEQEIQFIQSFKNEKAKEALVKNLNKGQIRVIIGSTEMLGTGINAQQRVVAIHHLDTTWTPSGLQQRNGRGIRKGNWVAQEYNNNKVDVFVYAVKQTLDVYKFNLLATKQNFISQIKNNEINVRRIDEGSMDEKTGLNYNEYIAILSGDTTLLEKAKLEKELTQLKAEEKAYLNQQKDKGLFVAEIENNIVKSEHVIQSLEVDLKKWNLLPRNGNGDPVFQVNLAQYKVDPDTGTVTLSEDSERKTYNDVKEGGIALNGLIEVKEKDTMSGSVVGNFYGFDIIIKPTIISGQYENRLYVKGALTYSHNHGILPRTPELAGEAIIKALSKIEPLLKNENEKNQQLKKDLQDITLFDNKEFPKKRLMQEKETELKQLIQKVEKNIELKM